MADSRIKITLRGDMPSGTIELRKLATFSEDFQDAIDEMAYSLERNRGSKAERRQVIYETSLSLVGLASGSTEILVEQTDRGTIPIYPNLIRDTAEHLVDGIEVIRQYQFSLREMPTLPSGWDESVVQKVYSLGKVFRYGINEIELEVVTPQRISTTIYDQPVRAKLKQLFSESRERIESVTGQLLLVDFVEKEDENFLCRIYPDVGSKNFIKCYFEEEISELIKGAVRKTVGAVGIAAYDSVTNEITQFSIKQIFIHELGTDIAEFDNKVREALRTYRLENDTLAGFETAWKQVIAGDTHDISTLWDDFDDE